MLCQPLLNTVNAEIVQNIYRQVGVPDKVILRPVIQYRSEYFLGFYRISFLSKTIHDK